MAKTAKPKIVHKVTFFTVRVEVIQTTAFPDCHEWRFVDEQENIIYQSDNGYGNAGVALRDGLLVVCGEPNRIRSAELERARQTISKRHA